MMIDDLEKRGRGLLSGIIAASEENNEGSQSKVSSG